MALRIFATGTAEILAPAGRFQKFTLTSVGRLIGGAAEKAPMRVKTSLPIGETLFDLGYGHVMWCDRDGEAKDLPYNSDATYLVRASGFNQDVLGTVVIVAAGEME